jgi:hypothetical protein
VSEKKPEKKPKLGDHALRLLAQGKHPKEIEIKNLISEHQELKPGHVLIMLGIDQPYPIKTLPGTSIPVKRGIAVNFDATKIDMLPPGWSVINTVTRTGKTSTKSAEVKNDASD